jgi:hypothetical protein
MDALEHLLAPGRELLARVDAALVAGGAPAEHPIWPLLRRVGALPGDAAGSVAELAPTPVENAAVELRALAEAYARRHAAVGGPVEWTGAAADAFGARWARLGAYLGTNADPEESSLAGRVAACAAYLEDVTSWMRSARGSLASALATVLGSAEAVGLRAGSAPAGPPTVDVLVSAAGIGVRVLDAVAVSHDDGFTVARRWAAPLGELAFAPGAEPGASRPGESTTVTL